MVPILLGKLRQIFEGIWMLSYKSAFLKDCEITLKSMSIAEFFDFREKLLLGFSGQWVHDGRVDIVFDGLVEGRRLAFDVVMVYVSIMTFTIDRGQRHCVTRLYNRVVMTNGVSAKQVLGRSVRQQTQREWPWIFPGAQSGDVALIVVPACTGGLRRFTVQAQPYLTADNSPGSVRCPRLAVLGV